MITYICPNCTNTVRAPGQMQRSWCPHCELYLQPLAVDPETMEEADDNEGTPHNYSYTTHRPRGNTFQRGETPEHRFMFVKRTDRLIKGPKGVSFKAGCTCKGWKHSNDFTTYRRAHTQWEAHMGMVDNQGSLNVG